MEKKISRILEGAMNRHIESFKMSPHLSQLTAEIPFMASLWIRSGYDMKVEPSAETYQVGAHFKALNEAVLMIRVSQSLCGVSLTQFSSRCLQISLW